LRWITTQPDRQFKHVDVVYADLEKLVRLGAVLVDVDEVGHEQWLVDYRVLVLERPARHERGQLTSGS
jgi:hypothetical protein